MTKEIRLTRGKVAIVDDEDYPVLAQFKWMALSSTTWGIWYAARYITGTNGKQHALLMHRVVNDTPDGLLTDHRNGDGLDNRRSNLRTATHAQNMQNIRQRKHWSSQYRGVSWDAKAGKWRARAWSNNVCTRLGWFTEEEDAAAVVSAWRAQNMPYAVEATEIGTQTKGGRSAVNRSTALEN
jgi:hypothetical protein